MGDETKWEGTRTSSTIQIECGSFIYLWVVVSCFGAAISLRLDAIDVSIIDIFVSRVHVLFAHVQRRLLERIRGRAEEHVGTVHSRRRWPRAIHLTIIVRCHCCYLALSKRICIFKASNSNAAAAAADAMLQNSSASQSILPHNNALAQRASFPRAHKPSWLSLSYPSHLIVHDASKHRRYKRQSCLPTWSPAMGSLAHSKSLIWFILHLRTRLDWTKRDYDCLCRSIIQLLSSHVADDDLRDTVVTQRTSPAKLVVKIMMLEEEAWLNQERPTSFQLNWCHRCQSFVEYKWACNQKLSFSTYRRRVFGHFTSLGFSYSVFEMRFLCV